MKKLGILAYGSLIENPGKELKALICDCVDGVETPFPVEFARSSSSRDGAPTVIPVDEGGSHVRATILVLAPDTSVERAKDLLWRRETHKEDTDKHYNPPAKPGPNDVIVKRLDNFHGIETVLYTHIGTNIKKRTPQHLADLAICSARQKAGAKGMDGISYLMSRKRQEVRTQLTPDYETAILKKTGASSLEDALKRIRAGDA